MSEDGRVSLKQLATQLGLTRSHARKFAIKVAREYGFSPQRMQTRDSGVGPAALTFSMKEADIIVAARKNVFPDGDRANRDALSDTGWLYLIQLVPELDPKRIKLGFASNVEDRLSQLQTAAPTARCIKQWPSKRTWELTAIDCLTDELCKLIRNEVYECGDIDALCRKADRFFEFMPTVRGAPPRVLA
jgi:hypothetical protein